MSGFMDLRWPKVFLHSNIGLVLRVLANGSVCLSVCPFANVPVIVSSRNFQELLPLAEVMSMQKVKVKGQRSRLQRSKPNLAVSRLYSVTPV